MRIAAALATIAVLATGCSDDTPVTCPGEPVATFQFEGSRVTAGDPSLAGFEPDPALPDCPPAVGYDAAPTLEFEATLARDPESAAATLCRPREIFLFGRRAGERYVLETGSSGAVLTGCAASCAAALRLVVAGDVLMGPDGEPASFRGVLVEVMSYLDGDCGQCLPPSARACAGRYRLTTR